MKKVIKVIYIVVFLMMCLIPGTLLLVSNNDTLNENHSSLPKLIDNGKVNENISNDMEGYIIKNIGFRSEILQMNAKLRQSIFHSSSVDNVIIGDKGYLYFGDTLDDYLGINLLNDREVFIVATTINQLNKHFKDQGKKFILVIAPNKNSLYDHMPYNYLKVSNDKNYEKLFNQLDKSLYVDLYDLFNNLDEELYFKTDSHWNSEGARLAYDKILNQLNKTHDDFTSYQKSYEIKHTGDLWKMLYPSSKAQEEITIYDKETNYQYETKTRSTEDNFIITNNDNAEGTLLMIRDSFANNLVDYFSDAYHKVIYDKRVPFDFDLANEYEADTIIFEIVERNIDYISTSKPKFMANKANPIKGQEKKIIDNIIINEEDNYYYVEGKVSDELVDVNTLVYLSDDNHTYELSLSFDDDSELFYGYFDKSLGDNLVISITNGNDIYQEKVIKNEVLK